MKQRSPRLKKKLAKQRTNFVAFHDWLLDTSETSIKVSLSLREMSKVIRQIRSKA